MIARICINNNLLAVSKMNACFPFSVIFHVNLQLSDKKKTDGNCAVTHKLSKKALHCLRCLENV